MISRNQFFQKLFFWSDVPKIYLLCISGLSSWDFLQAALMGSLLSHIVTLYTFSCNRELMLLFPFHWQVAKMSVQTGIISEYTSMIILETGDGKRTESPSIKMVNIDVRFCSVHVLVTEACALWLAFCLDLIVLFVNYYYYLIIL